MVLKKRSADTAQAEDKAAQAAQAAQAAGEQGRDTGPRVSARPAEVPGHQEASVQRRDRRMFGMLMGHLKRARTTLDKDKVAITKQQQALSQADKRVQAERAQLRERQRQLLLERQAKEARRRRLLDAKRTKDRLGALVGTWMTHHHQIAAGGWLVTETQPPLLWQPKQ